MTNANGGQQADREYRNSAFRHLQADKSFRNFISYLAQTKVCYPACASTQTGPFFEFSVSLSGLAFYKKPYILIQDMQFPNEK